jgi:hypothetical protein
MGRRATDAFANLLLVLGSLGLGLLAVEAALRLSIPASNVDLFAFDSTSTRLKLMKPHVRGVVYGVPFETNAAGFRDRREWESPKPADVFRVIVLGDSYTAAAGVPFDSIVTQFAEAGLRGVLPGRRVEVLNLAVGGYNVIQYRATFDEVAATLDPDFVVIALFPFNDFQMEDYQTHRARAGGTPPRPREVWWKTTYSYRAFGSRLEAIARRTWRRVARSAPAPREVSGPSEDGWSRNAQALAGLADRARERGMPALAILLPVTSSFAAQQPLHDRVARLCEECAIPCLDLLPAFTAAGTSPHRYRLNLLDAHPNPRYCRLAGNTLAESLRSRLAATSTTRD